ncbi:MAG UNVERIFIED_CONTAM: hypothetical protein LVR18_37515 [Planctomycetaceae bacterium]
MSLVHQSTLQVRHPVAFILPRGFLERAPRLFKVCLQKRKFLSSPPHLPRPLSEPVLYDAGRSLHGALPSRKLNTSNVVSSVNCQPPLQTEVRGQLAFQSSEGQPLLFKRLTQLLDYILQPIPLLQQPAFFADQHIIAA